LEEEIFSKTTKKKRGGGKGEGKVPVARRNERTYKNTIGRRAGKFFE